MKSLFGKARAVFPILALCSVAQSGTSVSADNQSDPARVISFIEVRHVEAERARTLLQNYARALRHGTSVHVEVAEEIGRPQRFVMLETAPRVDELTHAEAGAQAILAPLNEWLIAPPDRRAHGDFGAEPAMAEHPTGAHARGNPPPLYVISHLDLVAPNQARGEQALRELADRARQSPGNVRFLIWQQANRPNHFNLVSVWDSEAQFNTFTDGEAGRAFRSSITGITGSPYDERLYRGMD